MPVFGKVSDDVYANLRAFNIDEQTARDFVTVNGSEVLQSVFAGTVSAVGLYFAWKEEDKEAFSKTAGSILFSGSVMLNPIVFAIAIVALAFGYQKLVCPNAVAKGSVVTGVSFLISALIPGPVVLGLIPAIVVAIYLNRKMDKNFDVAAFSKACLSRVREQAEAIRART